MKEWTGLLSNNARAQTSPPNASILAQAQQLRRSFRTEAAYWPARGEWNSARGKEKECMCPAAPYRPEGYKHSSMEASGLNS